MPRPPRPAASGTAGPSTALEEADPDYLALTTRQRRAIDQAFDREIARLGRRASRKKRRPDPSLDSGRRAAGIAAQYSGGFVDDEAGGEFDGEAEGGFDPDETGEGSLRDEDGGFLPDDEGGFLPDDEGGFLPEDEGDFPPEDQDQPGPSARSSRSPSPSAPARLPLYLLPTLLTALGLPSDEDVLAVFRSSASGWEEDADTGKRKKRADEDLGVEKKDFRAVCAALMGPDEGGDDQIGDAEQDMSEDDAEEEDAFLPSEGESDSSLSSLSGSSYGGSGKGKSKSTPRTRTKVPSPQRTSGIGPKTRRKAKALEVRAGKTKLSSRQREMTREIWEMLRPPGREGARGGGMLGREELKGWVRKQAEMWSEDEITEMISLFSTQHEGRGLSFDDFGVVMLRAGLV